MRRMFTPGLSRRTFSQVVLGLLLLVLSGGLLLGGAVRTTHASGPAIQISPNSGPYGTVTVVTGQGFAPHEQVAIYKGSRPFFAYETDANGNFTGSPHPLIGPGPVNGIITISGTGRTSGLKATCIFTVTQ